MSNYLLVESRDPFESKSFQQRCELALTLSAEDSKVTVFLVENAVLAARAGAKTPGLDRLAKAGVRLFADQFALQERGIVDLAPVVVAAELDALVGELASGARTLWN
jgi:sulfur relay (sulfurtransferase) complex TusBCD TusD component (DsrE family)